MQKGWMTRLTNILGGKNARGCEGRRVNTLPSLRSFVCPIIILAVLALSGCRRDLWIYTDQFRQVELITDWSDASEKPDGMTWWFMNTEEPGDNYHRTVAEVTHTWLDLPRGTYSGVVFDYSPDEYSHQEFVGMEHIDSALVHLRAAADQPSPDVQLFGDSAVASYMEGIPRNPYNSEMYTVAAEPEIMNADTIHDVTVVTGEEGELIRWEKRGRYAELLATQTLHAYPKPIVWELRVLVHVRGINYMRDVRGSVSGLTDGCWLGTLRHTSTPCLQSLDSWQRRLESDNEGYITTSVKTFGLPDLDMPPSPLDMRNDQATRVGGYFGDPNYNEHLRLNLRFLLRDQATVLTYHFNVGEDCITINEDQLVVRIDIPIDYPGAPDLPYVDEVEGAGFDATVTPWADGGTADETM